MAQRAIGPAAGRLKLWCIFILTHAEASLTRYIYAKPYHCPPRRYAGETEYGGGIEISYSLHRLSSRADMPSALVCNNIVRKQARPYRGCQRAREHAPGASRSVGAATRQSVAVAVAAGALARRPIDGAGRLVGAPRRPIGAPAAGARGVAAQVDIERKA